MRLTTAFVYVFVLALIWTIAMGIQHRVPYRSTIKILLLCYLFALIQVTRPIVQGNSFQGIDLEFSRAQLNLDLFRWRDHYPIRSRLFVTQVVGNVVMFMPFGFLIPALNPRRARFWKTFCLSLLLTLCIEGSQYIASALSNLTVRYADIDDVFLNTLGGILGHIGFLLFKPLLLTLQAREVGAVQVRTPE